MIDIGRHRLAQRVRSFHARSLLLLAVPFLAAACVTVTDQGAAPGSAAPAPTPIVDPLATPTQAPLATPTPAPTPEPTPVPVAAEVFGFLPNWLVDDAKLALDSDLLTTVAFNGVEASGDGKLVARKPGGVVPPGWKVLQSEAFDTLRSELQADGVDVVLTVQRFGWTDGAINRTENLLTNRKNRRQLAERIAKLVKELELDGVNLDFEPMPDKLTDRYSAFVREVRAALDDVDEELKLSVDVVSDLAGYDLAALTADDAADAVVIMGYNYRGDNAARAASAAPLVDAVTGDLTSSVQEAIAQAPADKIILALPWYGKAWSTESDQAGSATVSGRGIDGSAEVPFAAAVEFAGQGGRRYEAGQASAWTAYPSRQCASCEAVWRQVWYEDSESFGAKIDLALEQDLAGVGIWALGHEAGRPELWWTLRDRLRPRVDDAPPNGSASLDPEAVLGTSAGLDVVQGSAPLRLFASDGTEGSGLAFVRIGLDAETAEDGRLVMARTYPAVERIEFPLGDPETGGSAESGPRSIHVQWQDIAGNWSIPLVLEAQVEKPESMPTPEDFG